MFDDVETLLRSFRHQDVVFVPNGGNAGDGLIAHATYQFLDRIGLRYDIGVQSENYPHRVVIHGGGGNLVDPYPNAADFIDRHIDPSRVLVILPHTIRAHERTVSRFGPNCFVFCREKPSLDYVRAVAPSANTTLSHDMAFAWNPELTERQMREQWRSDIFNRTLLVRDAKRHVRALAYRLATRGRTEEITALRTDLEKTNVTIPRHNIDLSHAFCGDDMMPDSSLHTAFWLMWFINQFKAVRTNRLHIAILSAILGRNVRLSDNRYGKLRDVYEHSMRGRFPNATWEPLTQDDPLAKLPA